jgi:hypothetical protein
VEARMLKKMLNWAMSRAHMLCEGQGAENNAICCFLMDVCCSNVVGMEEDG